MKRKYQLLRQRLVTLVMALSIMLTFSQPSYAQSSEFFCGINKGEPTTFVRTLWGNIPIIRWVDDSFPSPWSPSKRCKLVSARFEKFYQNGTLKYLKAGQLRGQPVLCVAGYKGGNCLPNGVLVTLKPGVNPQRTLEQLLNKDTRTKGQPMAMGELQTGNNFITEVNNATYFDIERFLNENNM
ncbi:MAG: COP23 domain-containing protein [Coleofasciculaceae cyanobacterium]